MTIRAKGDIVFLKRLKASLTLIIFACVIFVFVGCKAQASSTAAPNAAVPSIMLDDTLYSMSQLNQKIDLEVDESDYLGYIKSTVPLSQLPTENEQANIDVEGAPYAKYENGIIVWWNDKWTLFLTKEERLAETK